MSKRLMTIAGILLVLLGLFLAVAWYDGGRQEERLIVQPVEIAEEDA
ncbi:hypothetical protein OZN62_02995 [Aurantiacibacter sp. MUD11]|nr:hypothetical protein [Aurantiacibacter sp. MUD11]WAT18563.1 hypothetical protein OZN62_02995 [Aurantiacibacter sp. MUD11]